MIDIIGAVLMIVGASLTMIGGIGVVRFGDVMSRAHAAAKAPTLGLLLVALGAALEIGTGEAMATLGLVVVLQLLTSPVATHVLTRAAYGQVAIELDGEDDLAEYRNGGGGTGTGTSPDTGTSTGPDTGTGPDTDG